MGHQKRTAAKFELNTIIFIPEIVFKNVACKSFCSGVKTDSAMNNKKMKYDRIFQWLKLVSENEALHCNGV